MLRRLYKLWRIPTDQFDKRPEDKARFVRAWNLRSSRDDSEGDLMHYMKTKRKGGNWEKLGADHQRYSAGSVQFSDEELKAAEEIYNRLFASAGIGSDNIGYDQKMADMLSSEFAIATGRIVNGTIIYAALMAIRKRGNLVKAGRVQRGSQHGFGDIDEIAS
ncbi:hypothetical protein [Caulifigura coniformis]|uniref:hypothetical protein n=1 Tax=Caulifigura coniformis TaxID=2527983 RepID=UPI0011AA833B|nr:hypothetical protein [Caulifigura coniformis]